jgi:DNA-binding SARP family transcriptional activator/tetratricopeptide (TPR) repeat protein
MSASHISSELHNQPQPVLRIHLLGPPTVVWGDQSLHIPRRMVRALLYRLAYSEQSVSRQHLHLLFWPDHPEEIARRNLSHHLTHLRKSLPCPHALVSRGDQICLNRELVLCDVVQFKQVMVAENWDIAAIQKAIDGYHGPLLEGFDLPSCAEFEHWMFVEQNSLERLYLETLTFLVDQLIDQGSINEAIRYAQRYLETEELSEQMHCILIELLAAKGDRRAALDQFEICTAVLERELGVDPLPETRAVYQAVLNGQSRFPQPIRLIPSHELPGQKMPLVGRSQMMKLLDSLLSGCQEQGGQVVLISGEAGIGKSRLMQEFADQYQNKMQVLSGFAHRGESTIPYHPIVEAFRPLLLDNALDNDGKSRVKGKPSPWLENIEPIWLAEISRLLPELRAKIPNLAAPLVTDAETARTRLFEALGNLLKSLTANGKPVILCLDDLQWSDGSTQAWLVHLSEMMRQSSLCVFILGSYRSDEVDQVRDLRRSISRLGILTELDLPGLSGVHVRKFIRHVIGDRIGLEILARKLQKATGGNPYFLTETLRTLLEEEKLDGDLSMAELPLPESVREAIKARIQRLDAKQRQVMEAGAVLGYTFAFDLLQLTAGRGELETMDCLDELAARQLVLERGAEFSFIHELTQRTVVEGLRAPRRSLLHLRAGKAYLSTRPEANVQLAYHFENGGDTYNAIKYHGLAAQRAQSLFAWSEAEYHHGKMLDIIEQLDPQTKLPEFLRQRGRILADRAHNRFLQNRLSERDADLLKLEQLARISGDEQVELISILERVVAFSYSGKYNEAVALAKKGLKLAERINDKPARLRILAQTGLAHYLLGQPRAALSALDPALELSKEGKDLETRVDISQFLGHVHYHLGNYKESLANHQEAYNCSRKIGDRGGMAWSLMNRGLLRLKLCQWNESKQNLEEGLSLARQTGIYAAEGYAYTLLGQWELCQGNYAGAYDHLTRAMPIHQAGQSEHMMVINEEESGVVFYQLGDLDNARIFLQRAIDRARLIGFCRLLAGALTGMGLVEISSGHFSTANTYLQEAVILSREIECSEYLSRALTTLSRAKRLTGELTEASKCAADAEKIALENDLVVNQMWAHLEAGLALLEQGELERALERAQQAVALVGQAHEAWIGSEQVYLGYAKVLRAVGQIQKAEEQKAMADEIIRAKAERITKPKQRLQFLQRYQDTTF